MPKPLKAVFTEIGTRRGGEECASMTAERPVQIAESQAINWAQFRGDRSNMPGEVEGVLEGRNGRGHVAATSYQIVYQSINQSTTATSTFDSCI